MIVTLREQEADWPESLTEHCDRCNNPLEPSQIGSCDSCQLDGEAAE